MWVSQSHPVDFDEFEVRKIATLIVVTQERNHLVNGGGFPSAGNSRNIHAPTVTKVTNAIRKTVNEVYTTRLQ